MPRHNTMLYKDPSFGGDNNTFQGHSIQIVLPPKPGSEGDNYNDNSFNDDGESRMDVCALTLSCLAQDPNLPSSKLPFAWKLYEMLETVHKNKVDTEIVSWVDDGKAFKVHDLNRFVDEIVPTYFKQSKYKSFQRQLYFYGFTREASNSKRDHTPGSYRHPKFLRGKKTLCLSMAPKKAKKRGGKSPVVSPDNLQSAQPDVAVARTVSLEVARVNSLPSGSHNSGRIEPQSQFNQQQSQLQRLQMEGFLRSLQQNDGQNIPVPPRDQVPPAPTQLRASVSEGLECNMFGGTFHAVSNNRSR